MKRDLSQHLYAMLSHAERLGTIISENDILGYIESFEEGWYDGSKYVIRIDSLASKRPNIGFKLEILPNH